MNLQNTIKSAMNNHPYVVGVLIFVLILWGTGIGRRCASSNYSMSPTPITVDKQTEPSGLFKMPYNIDCTPGAKNGAYYTRDLTPGGMCGGQQFVADMNDYKITGGVGGSLIGA